MVLIFVSNVRSLQERVSGVSLFARMDLLCSAAHCFISVDPKRQAISIKESASSCAMKKGYLPVSKDRRITPTDQISMAVMSKEKH
jgi:hypothetical protein